MVTCERRLAPFWRGCTLLALAAWLSSTASSQELAAVHPDPTSVVSNSISGAASRVIATNAAAGTVSPESPVTAQRATTNAAQPHSPTLSATVTSALSRFQLEPGFKIQLVAAEPLITAPVAMAFDENGRLFVVERPARPAGPGQPVTGQISVLESFDDNGAAQSSRVYSPDIPFASAVACYAGGVFVAAGRDILYLKEDRQKGGADVHQVVLSGFGGTNAPDVHQLVNSFVWGLDDRIYGVTAGLGGLVGAADWPSGPVSLDGCDFSFDPRSLAVFPEAGPAEAGQTFDYAGHRFTSGPKHPLRLAMYEQRYLARNPFFPPAESMIEAARPGLAVYAPAAGPRKLPGQPRTPIVESQEWLTDAASCLVYRGSLFPTNYSGNVFIASPRQHLIHRALLRDNSFGIAAERPSGEQRWEFLASSDPSFQPVQIISGPEGALYIADYQDGQNRGRIYRVVPARFKPSARPELGRSRLLEVVSALASPNAWHSDTAARLLYERRSPAAGPLLAEMLEHSPSPLARLRALHALNNAGALREAQELHALKDNDAVVREHAVQLAEAVVTNGVPSEALWAQLKSMTADPILRVRYQLAFTVGNLRRPDRSAVLAELLRRDPANRWMQTAVLSSAAYSGGDLFVLLASNNSFLTDPAGHDFLVRLAGMLGVQGRLGDVLQPLEYVARVQLAPLQTFSFLAAVGDGLYHTASALPLLDPRGILQPFFTQARDATAAGNLLPDATRVAAIRLLTFSTYTFSDLAPWLSLLCTPQAPPAVEAAAILALGRYDDPRAVTGLLNQWNNLNPALRSQALDAWLSRDSHVPAVFEALSAGIIGTNEFSAVEKNFLRTYPADDLRQKALTAFGPFEAHRPAVLEHFKPALQLPGNPDAGAVLFQTRCAACHAIGSPTQNLGPDLAGARTLGKERLLHKVIEPSAEVTRGYATLALLSKQGDNALGVSRLPNPTTIILLQAGGAQTIWPRLNIQDARTLAWSLMPDGLETGLSVQDMADLLAFLTR